MTRIEPKWIDVFEEMFGLCAVRPAEAVAILSESQSRRVLVELAELSLSRMGARVFHVVVPTPRAAGAVAIRSTGASTALCALPEAVAALGAATLIVDCTVEGLLHSPERRTLLDGGARIFMISNEHPEVFERLRPVPGVQEKCELGARMITKAETMRVTSAAGTDLTVDLTGVTGRGSAGVADRPGRMGYWPAGLCILYPARGSVNGRVVLAPGDANLTFKRYIEAPVVLTLRDDYVTDIEGAGLDAELFRGYFAAWGEPEAYAVSHLGWGMNPDARWDSLIMYDKGDVNGTELRAFAGNFLFSTGANEAAGRFTRGHFDIPIRNCSVQLDDVFVVRAGEVCADLRA